MKQARMGASARRLCSTLYHSRSQQHYDFTGPLGRRCGPLAAAHASHCRLPAEGAPGLRCWPPTRRRRLAASAACCRCCPHPAQPRCQSPCDHAGPAAAAAAAAAAAERHGDRAPQVPPPHRRQQPEEGPAAVVGAASGCAGEAPWHCTLTLSWPAQWPAAPQQPPPRPPSASAPPQPWPGGCGDSRRRRCCYGQWGGQRRHRHRPPPLRRRRCQAAAARMLRQKRRALARGGEGEWGTLLRVAAASLPLPPQRWTAAAQSRPDA